MGHVKFALLIKKKRGKSLGTCQSVGVCKILNFQNFFSVFCSYLVHALFHDSYLKQLIFTKFF